MKNQSKWERLFERFISGVDFTLIKNKDGTWSLSDNMGANLGDIESDKFYSAGDIIDRLDIYINDYFYGDLKDELEAYDVDLEGRDVPYTAEEWLALQSNQEFYSKNVSYFENHKFSFDVLDMIANHFEEIDLENIRYEEEE